MKTEAGRLQINLVEPFLDYTAAQDASTHLSFTWGQSDSSPSLASSSPFSLFSTFPSKILAFNPVLASISQRTQTNTATVEENTLARISDILLVTPGAVSMVKILQIILQAVDLKQRKAEQKRKDKGVLLQELSETSVLDIFHLTLQIYSLPSLLCSVPRKGDLCGPLQWASSPIGFRLVSQMEDTTRSPGGGSERQDVIRMFFPQLFPCKSRLLTRHPFHTTLSLSLSLCKFWQPFSLSLQAQD